MHGLPAAQEIVESVINSAQGRSAKVNSVEVEMGPDSTIDPGELELCFEMASKGTMLEGARIKINLIPGNVECLECGLVEQKKRIDRLPTCSSCYSTALKIKGEGIVIKRFS